MAEHVRNELARSHVPVRPNRILTLAKFLEPFTKFQDAPASLVHLLISRHPLPGFQEVAEFRGFHRALAALIQEAPAQSLPANLAWIARDIEDELTLRGRALRQPRLSAAEPIATGPIVIDGFFTFGSAELDLLEKLARQTSVTVTLPDSLGSAAARTRLLERGFVEEHFDQTFRQPIRTIFAATSLEQEVEHIALTILQHAERGREFREMGILLRVRDPYASALETTLARFGIPARFHFTDPLSAHPAIQYIIGIVRSLLTGWDHADLVSLLRMPVSGIGATPQGDTLDFGIRKTLPMRGVANIGGSDPFRPLEAWKQMHHTPETWATKLKTLRSLLPTPEITDHVDHQQLHIWRSTVAALNAFEEAVDITAEAFHHDNKHHDNKIPLSTFWPPAETAISLEQLRVPDHRRNVVNILDIYEARQWELPIAFVCGLNERHFPQYHREDPLFNDAARTRAALPTSDDRQREEQFLFELASTRATEETILSYARFNDKGDAQLRSFFLGDAPAESSTLRILPRTNPIAWSKPPAAPLRDLKTLHAKLAPTSIESFLQCPFQFFARKTLKLRQRPEKPRERLNLLLQGSIIHKALAEYSRTPMFGASWIDRVFEDECQRANIPRTYRREAVRLELLRHFEAFLADNTWRLPWPRQTELEFTIELTPELSIRGRIDRLDSGPNEEGIVIDYKYSAGNRMKDHIRNNDAGNLVQAGLYLSAAERAFHLHPSAMFYCGLRQPITWDGWHASVPGLTIGESRTPAALRELITIAEQTAIETFENIIAGNKQVRPADLDKCRYCDFNDICRKESIQSATGAA